MQVVEHLPLSYAQQRLWFLDRLEGSSAEYNLPQALRLKGELDVEALRRAVLTIIERHESLRTRFVEVDGRAIQVIEPETRLDLPVEDLSGLDERARDSQALQAFQRESEEPFDLAASPLLRMRLLKLTDREHVWIRTFHHIVFDGWSFAIFNREFRILYEAFHEGLENPLPPLPVQYADYTLWQRECLDEQTLGKELEFWKRQLAGIPEQLDLPKDRPRTARQTFAAEFCKMSLPAEATSALKRLGQANQATLYMTLLAGFAALLSRYSGQDDIVVGSPIANREEARLEDLIGFFINTLVMRVKVEDEKSFNELLTQVRETTLEAYRHQALPFERLVEELSPQRSLNTTPVFQVMFALQNAPMSAPALKGIKIDAVGSDRLLVHFDLEVHAWEEEGQVNFHWVYNRDLFDRWRIEQMVRHYGRLLDAVALCPERPIGRIDLLSAEEKRKILEEWNETECAVSPELLPKLWERQVERTPERVAVICGELQLTYRKTNESANRLAHYLVGLGAGPEDLVGICLERSAEMVIALLAVSKTGAAYLPLDPGYPPARLAQVVAEAAPLAILTTSQVRDRLPEKEQMFCLDEPALKAVLAQGPQHHSSAAERALDLLPHHPAYVIYTSGSTGTPKGTVISHESLANLLAWAVSVLNPQRLAHVLASTSLSFDVSVFEIFAPLIAGGNIEVVPNILQLLERSHAAWNGTLVSGVPSAFSILVEQGCLPRAEAIVLAGEALKLQLVRDIRKVLPNCRISNLYGPTEATVYTTGWHSDDRAGDAPNIGRPIWNTRVYVLDRNFDPVPVGVIGELCIAGTGPARGYLKQPSLTGERFPADPHGKPGTRMYRTGDLVRWRFDGQLEYIGRRDQQVKLRGHRIELGEIEALLQDHEKIAQALVAMRENASGEKQLVGYVVPRPGEDHIEISELRTHLRKRLPDHMLPAAIMQLQTIPITPNGKVDRRALPVPDRDTKTNRAPSTLQQEILCYIFAEALGLDEIGIDDNFFTNGGHSLLAAVMISRIRSVFQVELPLRAVFESPTPADLALRLNGASTAQRALLRQTRPEQLPLSYAQRRLWFVDQLEGASTEYHMPSALRLCGQLDITALEQAVNAMIARHEILRTCFPPTKDEPVQVIKPALRIDLPVEDLSLMNEAAQRERVAATLRQEWEQPFDLARGPLLRIRVLRINQQEHLLIRNFHHIIFDGWSQTIFNRELMILYEAFREGLKPQLKPLPVQYADFTLWQLKRFEGRELSESLTYWKTQLAGIPEQLTLPKDRPRGPRQTFDADVFRAALTHGQTAGLKSLSRACQATPYMTLMSAFAALLQYYSGQNDIVVGSPVANRQDSQLENLIGCFVNTIALRADVNPRLSFRDLLLQVRQTALEAYLHQEFPFERLVEELAPQRHLNTTPIYQVLFALQNMPVSAQQWKTLQVEGVAIAALRLHLDLEVYGWEHDGGIELHWLYNRELFDGGRVKQMALHFTRLIEAAVAAPGAPLYTLDILSDQERRQILVRWNQTQKPEAAAATMPELFEEQAKRTPHAIAVVHESGQLTYAELNRRANQLASFLRRLNVGPEVRVGICLERSPELIVVLLAVFKAGGAYVPLDPGHPPERLRFILADAQVPVLLTSARLADEFEPIERLRILYIEQQQQALSLEPGENPPPLTTPDNAAYIIYTSGSTGKPKGVVVRRQALGNLLASMLEITGLDRPFTMPAITTISFDMAVPELYLPLIAGGTIVLVDRETARDGKLLRETMRATQVDVLQATPATWKLLLEARWDEPLVVLCGADALTWDIAKMLLNRATAATNLYGPTETTVWSTYQDFHTDREQRSATVPIGDPIGNTRLYVLNAHLEPVPIGVFGELYIAGVGLARGYLNQPDLTAERFIADPHGAPGSRLYRTGDLAWRRNDGKLEFAGRADHQVKIRGFRIELGEIEAVLREHESVREAAAAVREDRRGEKHLVGFLVEREGAAADHAQLRNYLKQRLPGYMVPPVLVKLERLPLNPNGKIDRKSLPPADLGNADQEYVGPRSETERALAEIWSELLGVPQVGIHDNFFSMGGHSLLATRLVTRIAAILGAELPVRAVFEAPTIAELATYPQLGGRTRPPLTAQRRPDRIPLSYAQQRLWFIDQMEGSSAEYNLPQALRLRGELDRQALQRAVAAIVERHEILRTRFVLMDGVPLQIIESELHIPLHVEDLTLLEPTAQSKYVTATIGHEWDLPFDLARGPLLRMQLLRLGRNDHVLVWTFHHIISDGWSQILFTRELMALYGAFHRGAENPLPPLLVQYADFTLWQRSWLNDDMVERELQYWKRHLEDMPEELRLPKDWPRPRLLTSAADFRRISLQPELAAAIKRLGQENQATLYMVLLTAFTALLSRYSGQDDLIVGSPIANRQEPQLEQLLGFFVNSLAMRVQVRPRQSVRELLAAVRTTALDAYLHQDLPFERLVQELSPQRSLNRTPIFQVLFALQNAPVWALPTGDLQVEPAGGDNHRIHFDLEVHAWEQSGGIEFYWLYNRDLFDPRRMEQMTRHYQQIIAAMVANPDAQVCDLEMLDDAEKRELVGEANRTWRSYFRGCVHEMFEVQAALTPDAVAVRHRTEQYTYDALNRQAGRLAHRLRAAGIGCGDRVGICMERGPEMPGALLGVLRAGGTYVPLDVSYPAERLKSMAEDSGAKLILTTRNELRFAEQTRQRVLLVDDQDVRGLSGVGAPAPAINPEELAYVIYTSGSTGRPKGVAVSHRALSNYVCWANGAYYSAAGSGSPVVSSLSFDLTITSIFPALTLGKTIELQADVEELADALQGPGQYSLVKITPSHLKLLGGRQRHDGTAALIIGGEALFYEDIAEWMRPGRRIINEYGPTEATVGCCAYEAASEACAHGPVPIGKPIGNMQIYVLDRELKLVPPGVTGELYIGGAGLARGYLNQPELTAERFVPDALGGRSGSRLYRSGDLVSRRFDSNLEFLGRVDDQVKIRGFRIELGEVEAALSRHPDVLAAAVTVRERKPGDQRLVAYVALRERALLTSGELRDYARRVLPEYMAPSHIHLVAKIPLSKNGKVDRRQLPTFEDEGELAPASATPGTMTEETLAQIWSEALGLEQVGLDHNFFDLGGHSLLIPGLRLAIREKLHRDVSIVDFFVYPTVRSLARRLEQTDEQSYGVSDSEDRATRRRTYLWSRRERLEA